MRSFFKEKVFLLLLVRSALNLLVSDEGHCLLNIREAGIL